MLSGFWFRSSEHDLGEDIYDCVPCEDEGDDIYEDIIKVEVQQPMVRNLDVVKGIWEMEQVGPQSFGRCPTPTSPSDSMPVCTCTLPSKYLQPRVLATQF